MNLNQKVQKAMEKENKHMSHLRKHLQKKPMKASSLMRSLGIEVHHM